MFNLSILLILKFFRDRSSRHLQNVLALLLTTSAQRSIPKIVEMVKMLSATNAQ